MTSDIRERLQTTLGTAYTLERELGGGGMARVFLALDRQLDRRVVVKTLAADVGAAVSAERFRREIRLAASLQQANIVPVHSAGDIDGVPYYTMPFVEGQSLRARLNGRGALDPREAVGILRDVARALAFAHERGVVHRDIKPENILLSGNTAVVTDFGIAKAIEASHAQAPATTLTQLGTLLGTPAYVAPEQAAGDPDVGHLADVYSLGIVAYEMLAGGHPFPYGTARELLVAHLGEAPAPLAERRPGLPPRLAALVMRCLEKDPSRRPPGAAALLDAFEGALSGGPADAAHGIPSVAVLPFANLSPDPADEFFADGLTDEIITDLSGIRSLRTIARAAMMRFKGTNKDPGAVARELRARYVLDGSVRRAGQSLRLTMRLIDADADATIWSDKMNGTMDDVFAMQERVSRTIVDALRITLSPREAARLAARPIEDLQAYEAYLHARLAMWTFSPESLERAQHLLEAARSRIGDDPRLVAALGVVHLNFIETGLVDAAAHLSALAAHVDRLATIDPESPSRYALLGAMQWRRGHIKEAIASLSRALELEPSNADVAVYLCYAHLLAGQDARARTVADLVVALDPLTPLFQCMPGFCEIMAGRADAAIARYRAFAEADPHNPVAQYFFLVALAEAEDTPRATDVADRLARHFPDTVFGRIAALYARVMRGDLSPRDVVVTPEMRAHAANSDAFARPLGILLAQMAVHEAAIDAIESSVNIGLAHYPYLARDSRVLAAVRDHPRFRRLLEVVRGRWERGGASADDARLDTKAAVADTTRSAPAPDVPSIAVLPFANLSSDPENEYFSDGITEDLIAQISRTRDLKVISRTSSMRYKGTDKALRMIAEELGAAHILEGSVRRSRNRVRIVAQLIDAASDRHLWAETYDRELTDIFEIQGEVALQVANSLQRMLSPADRARMRREPTKSMEAYDLYLLGRHQASMRADDGLRRAVEYFERAIEKDPEFAAAYAGLADAWVLSGLGYRAVPPRDAMARAKASALSALALDESLPEAHASLGYAYMFEWDWPRSRAELDRALALNPSYAQAHEWLAHYFLTVRDFDAQLVEAERARELDPLSVTIANEVGWAYYYMGEPARARVHHERARDMDPGFAMAHYNIAGCYSAEGRYDEAIPAFHRALELAGRLPFMVALLAEAYARSGRRDDAQAILRELLDNAGRAHGVELWIALVYEALGEPEAAMAWLTRAFDARAPFMMVIDTEWARFDSLHDDPRFLALIDRLGLAGMPRGTRGRRRSA